MFGPSSAIVDEMGGWPDEEFAFVIDSTIVGLIGRIDVETDVAADSTASDVV
ncbi:MAG: hypothetical protein V5A28_01430 [Haloarculaceae archaeon]